MLRAARSFFRRSSEALTTLHKPWASGSRSTWPGAAYITGGTSHLDFPTTANAFIRNPPSGSGENSLFINGFVSKFDANGSLVYSTFLGGNGSDFGGAIAVDSCGNAYVTGATASKDFPVLNASQSVYGGADSGLRGDAFVTKLDGSGSSPVYSTFLGGA